MTGLLLALLALQQPVDTGRADRPCLIAIDSVGRLGRQDEVVPAQPGSRAIYNYYGGGGVWAHCDGTGSTLTADSVAWYGGQQRLDLIGHVRIRDALMDLDAATARYYTPAERLEAHTEVVAVNRANGSVLRGPNLTYLRAIPGVRDSSELLATARPTIQYRSGADTSDPYVVIGDRVRMRGKQQMWAGGRVTVDRSDLAARADSMALDETAGFGVLVGAPVLEGKGERPFRLIGVRIELELDSSDVRVVKALGRGEATGQDWRLTADTIQLSLADGKLQQTFAWGDSMRPRAVSTHHTVQADSIALDTPGEVLTELRAFRQALSTSRRDRGAAADVDWIAGDTLVGGFSQVTDSAGRSEAELQRLVARGNARSLTHMYEPGAGGAAGEADSAATPDINYSRGTSIAIRLAGDRIDSVIVTGRADGVHLERRPRAPTDTAGGTRPSPQTAPPTAPRAAPRPPSSQTRR